MLTSLKISQQHQHLIHSKAHVEISVIIVTLPHSSVILVLIPHTIYSTTFILQNQSAIKAVPLTHLGMETLVKLAILSVQNVSTMFTVLVPSVPLILLKTQLEFVSQPVELKSFSQTTFVQTAILIAKAV